MIDESVSNLIKSKNKKIALFIGAVTLLFAVIRIIVTRFYIDPDIHFYTDNANVGILSFDYISAIFIIAVYITSMFIYRYTKDDYKYLAASNSFIQGTQTQVFSSSLAGFLLAASSVFQIYSLFKNDGFPLGERIMNYIKTYPFDFILFFVSILCAVYFFKTAALNYDVGPEENNNYEANNYINSDSVNQEDSGNKADALLSMLRTNGNGNEKKKNADGQYTQTHIFLSFTPILWSFLNIFKCFFDMSKAVNSPVRIYELMCFLALSAYFVSESRMIVGRHKISRFFTFGYTSVLFVALSALPNLILSAFWILKTNSFQIIYAIEISFALYISARIYSQIRYSKFLLER